MGRLRARARDPWRQIGSAHQKLGVEEVWIWRKGIIEIHVLAGGQFERWPRSRILPDLDLALLASMLDRNTITQAVRDFRKALAAGS